IQSKDETQTYWKLQAVDGRGRVQEERFGNGTRAKYTYDPDTLMRNGINLENADEESLAELGYTFKSSGRIDTRTLQLPGYLRSETFTYDGLQRLKTVTTAGAGAGTDGFDYSPSGRILSRGSVGQYDYDAEQPHAVSEAGGVTYEYDSRGNQVIRSGASVPGGRQRVLRHTAFDKPEIVYVGPSGDPSHRYDLVYGADQNRVVLTEVFGGAEIVTPGAHYERRTDGTGVITHVYRIGVAGKVVAERTLDE